MSDLSHEEVFDNDKDPVEALREIRREEGVDEADLIIDDSDKPSTPSETTPEPDDLEVIADKEPETEKDPVDKEEQAEADPETGEDDTESEDEGKATEEEAEKFKFKANGQDFEFTQEEIMEQFGGVFGKAMDFTKKTQQLAPYSKMVSALEDESISTDQLNTAIDAIKGDKQAIKSMMDAHKIDSFDLPDENEEGTPYVPTEYGKTPEQLQIAEIQRNIGGDEEFKTTVDIIDKQWDNVSRDAFSNNPNLIERLHNDVKSGMYDKVAPVAMQMQMLDGNAKSNLEYYMLAGEQVTSKENSAKAEKTVEDLNRAAQDGEQEFDKASSEADKKRSASSTRTRADRKGVVDYLDDNDEDFDAWYKKVTNV